MMNSNIIPFSSNSKAGTVYLITLLVVLVVASIAVVMADGAHYRLRSQDHALAAAQCRQAAMGVIRALVNDVSSSQVAGVLPGIVTVTPKGEELGECIVVVLGRDPNGQKLFYDLIPEAGKVDVSNASFSVLLAIPGISEDIAAAIVDWRDEDDVVYNDIGAEATDGAYQGATIPYAPRNGPFQTVDELRLIRGVTDELFFGEDMNQNGRLDAGEDRDGNGQLTRGLRDSVCIDSREPASTPAGEERIPIANDGRGTRMMRDRLRGLFGEERGDQITTELGQKIPFVNRLHFVNALTLTDDEILAVWNNFIGPEGRLGLLDAWSAPEPVLRKLVDDEITNAILAARPLTFTPNPAWLVKALTPAQAAIAGNYLTLGSYQFRTDVIAVAKDGSSWQRYEARIDCSTGVPFLSQLRNAQTAGWPFPWIAPNKLRQLAATTDLKTLLTTERN